MGSILSKIRDDIADYEGDCALFGEPVQYSHGSAACYGAHARALKHRARNRSRTEESIRRAWAEWREAAALAWPDEPSAAERAEMPQRNQRAFETWNLDGRRPDLPRPPPASGCRMHYCWVPCAAGTHYCTAHGGQDALP